jgi:hypothetical protein
MADTRRLAMLKAVESYLDGVSKPTGLTVHRFAHRAIEKDDLPSVVIAHDGGQEIGDDVNDLYENTDRVILAIQCLGTVSTEPDDSIDPYLSWVLTALEADPTLNGAVNRVDMLPTGKTEVAETDRIYIRIKQPVEVAYYQRRTDPESQL